MCGGVREGEALVELEAVGGRRDGGHFGLDAREGVGLGWAIR